MVGIEEFAKRAGITMSVVRLPDNSVPDWGGPHRAFACMLKCDDREMVVPFQQGMAHTVDPTIPDVLDCLASDAVGVANAGTFEEWAREFSLDPDSRKAEATYKNVQRMTEELARLLGPELFDQLLWSVDKD